MIPVHGEQRIAAAALGGWIAAVDPSPKLIARWQRGERHGRKARFLATSLEEADLAQAGFAVDEALVKDLGTGFAAAVVVRAST